MLPFNGSITIGSLHSTNKDEEQKTSSCSSSDAGADNDTHAKGGGRVAKDVKLRVTTQQAAEINLAWYSDFILSLTCAVLFW